METVVDQVAEKKESGADVSGDPKNQCKRCICFLRCKTGIV